MKFEQRYSVRIYDANIVKRLEKLYKSSSSIFGSLNPLIVECIERGLNCIEKELNGFKNIDNDSIFNEISKTTKTLTNLLKLVEEKFKEQLVSQKAIEKLVGCNYSILFGINCNKPKEPEYIEKGFYDKLPERFEEIIEEIIKYYK